MIIKKKNILRTSWFTSLLSFELSLIGYNATSTATSTTKTSLSKPKCWWWMIYSTAHTSDTVWLAWKFRLPGDGITCTVISPLGSIKEFCWYWSCWSCWTSFYFFLKYYELIFFFKIIINLLRNQLK